MKIKNFLKICIAISLIAFLFFNLRKVDIIDSLSSISLLFTFFCTAILIFIFILASIRVNLIISIFEKISYSKTWEINVISNASTFFLLPGVTSEISRFYLLQNLSNLNKSEIFISLLYDRFCGAIASFTMTIIGAFLIFQKAYNIGILLTLSFIIVFLLFSIYIFLNIRRVKYLITLIPWIRAKSYIVKLISISDQIEKKKLIFLFNIILSLLIQLGAVLIVFLISYDLDNPIDIRMLFFLLPGLSMIIALPISFGGLGLRELVFAAGFSISQVSKDVSIIIGFNYSVLLFFVVGVLFVLSEIIAYLKKHNY